ncbi:type VII secretion target [Umezawaea endophytica]|uniref:Type VII secretion target n=1 Tax=Umezawaea endophytica TaxID=1654476 RepID=A0A9X2VPP7_9PSEU|nr:type VII secretion target [Umezawaea endophytica]
MDRVNVSVGEVRTHADTVENLSHQVASAGTTVEGSVGGGAFGVFGASFTASLGHAADQVREAVAKGAESFTDVRIGLSQAADVYQQIDETQAQVFRGIGGGVDYSGLTTASGATASDTGPQGVTRGMSSVAGGEAFQHSDVVPVKLGRRPPPSVPGQRAKAVAVLKRISKEYPISVATVALRPVSTAHGWVGDVASAEIGDHYENDAGHLLRQPPTNANLREMAETETKFWNSDRGNWVGSLMSASTRYSMLVSGRDAWLNEFPPAERDRIAKQLGVRLGN